MINTDGQPTIANARHSSIGETDVAHLQAELRRTIQLLQNRDEQILRLQSLLEQAQDALSK